jgi:hypothetical protein
VRCWRRPWNTFLPEFQIFRAVCVLHDQCNSPLRMRFVSFESSAEGLSSSSGSFAGKSALAGEAVAVFIAADREALDDRSRMERYVFAPAVRKLELHSSRKLTPNSLSP